MNRTSACFRCFQKLGDTRKQTLSEIMNSLPAREHRQTLMRGEWPEGCRSCKDFEDRGLRSTRLHGIPHFDAARALEEYNPQTGEIKSLRSIEVRLSNLCNLACRHCNSVHSSRWEKIHTDNPGLLEKIYREPEYGGANVNEDFVADLIENIAPELEIIFFSGGEVLLQKAHYQILQEIPQNVAQGIELVYVTNGTTRGLPGWDLRGLWGKFKHVTLIVSTDGVGDLFNYFRVGADWKQVEDNLEYFGSFLELITCEVTCSIYQMFYLAETLDYLYERFPNFTLSSSLVQYPQVLNPSIIPPQLKKKLYDEWEEYIGGLTDSNKRNKILAAGQYPMNYMMGEQSSIYPTKAAGADDWTCFAEHVHHLDQLFKTDIKKTLPKIAETLPAI